MWFSVPLGLYVACMISHRVGFRSGYHSGWRHGYEDHSFKTEEKINGIRGH